jgi:hypothetical protein
MGQNSNSEQIKNKKVKLSLFTSSRHKGRRVKVALHNSANTSSNNTATSGSKYK